MRRALWDSIGALTSLLLGRPRRLLRLTRSALGFGVVAHVRVKRPAVVAPHVAGRDELRPPAGTERFPCTCSVLTELGVAVVPALLTPVLPRLLGLLALVP